MTRAEGAQQEDESIDLAGVDARYVLDQVTDALVIVDEEGRIVLFNPSAEELFGYRSSEVVGTPVHRLVPGETAQAHVALVSQFVADAGHKRLMAPERGLVDAVRHDGSRFPAAITVGTIELGGGRRLGMAAVRDESAVVDATERMVVVTEELERRNSELQQFLLSASHDLREPLRKVRAFSEQLAEAVGDNLDEWASLCLDRVVDAGARMSTLLDDLIGYTRLTMRDQPHVVCSLSDVVQEAVDDLSLRIQELGASIEVGDLPMFRGDRVLLRQLFQNLLGNALKFHRPGTPPVVTVAGSLSGRPDEVIITVDDEGIGIEPGYEERAFEPFRRMNTEVEFEGTGMGLTISRKVAELHGGDVTAHPNPAGRGTRMVVRMIGAF